jgi:hypothetical protein
MGIHTAYKQAVTYIPILCLREVKKEAGACRAQNFKEEMSKDKNWFPFSLLPLKGIKGKGKGRSGSGSRLR